MDPAQLCFVLGCLELGLGGGREWTETLGLCGGFLGGSGGGLTALILVGTGSFLIGGGGGFTAVTLVGSEGLLTVSAPGFTELVLVGCGSGEARDFA